MASTVKVNNVQASDGGNIINQCGTNITIGASGDTIALASGASQSGFGRSGSVNWQTTPKTTTFTAADGEGYFINSGSAITANLPAGSAGAIVAFSDYARNFSTYSFTVSPNGSEKIGGVAGPMTLSIDGQALTLVYVDSTKGWVNVQNAEDTEKGNVNIIASGGTETTCGNCKIHTFTGPGTFTVSLVAVSAACNQVSYAVVAGGGGGGGSGRCNTAGGGGGAGGFREDKSPITPYTASPLEGAGAITVTATSFPITVGAGGAGKSGYGAMNSGMVGSNSIFSTITSAGGGAGGMYAGRCSGGAPHQAGGSGGGGGAYNYNCSQLAGSGNSPPTTPSQGSNGGAGSPSSGSSNSGGGGGGATAVGTAYNDPTGGGAGGVGATTHISGSPVAYSGGGGGGGANGGGAGPSGGGAGASGGGCKTACSGTDNRGGGGGGPHVATSGGSSTGGNGGSGIVIIRYKFQ